MGISAQDVRRVFSEALEPGDDVFIHASLGRMGHFDAGVEDIVDALLEAISPDGTLVVMTDTRSFAKTGRFSLSQPSETGLLTEVVRQRPEARRSRVPMTSFAAIGPLAEFYTQEYTAYLEPESTMARVLERDAKIMLIGIAYEKCTMFHVAEERLDLPYNAYKTFEGIELDADGKEIGPISQRYFVRRDMSIKKNPAIAGEMLEARGQSVVSQLGDGMVRTFKARDFDQCCMDALRADPEAFLVKTETSS